jgi:V/A-type H+-transporting ATPase subunit F
MRSSPSWRPDVAIALQGSRGGPAGGALKLALLLRPGDAVPFRLAGARVEVAVDGEEGAVLRALLADGSVGVLAVEEELLGKAPPGLIRRARQRGVPVLLPFSLPRRLGEAGRGREYVAALIRRAIGYAVRLSGPGRGP